MTSPYLSQDLARRSIRTISGFWYYSLLLEGYSQDEIFQSRGNRGPLSLIDGSVKNLRLNLSTCPDSFNEFVKINKLKFNVGFFENSKNADFLRSSYRYILDIPECAMYLRTLLGGLEAMYNLYSNGNVNNSPSLSIFLFELLHRTPQFSFLEYSINNFNRQRLKFAKKKNESTCSSIKVTSDEIKTLKEFNKLSKKKDAYPYLHAGKKEKDDVEALVNNTVSKCKVKLSKKYFERYSDRRKKNKKFNIKRGKSVSSFNDVYCAPEKSLPAISFPEFFIANYKVLFSIFHKLSSSDTCFTFSDHDETTLEEIEALRFSLEKIQTNKEFTKAMRVARLIMVSHKLNI